MTIKNINQMNKEKIRIISKLKGNEITELCKLYSLKGYNDKEYLKDLENLQDYYLKNQQPNNLSHYEKLHNGYCACLGFYKGLCEYTYNQIQETNEIHSINLLEIFKNVFNLLFNCEKNLEILNMILSKNNEDLDDIIEEIYMLTVYNYDDLIYHDHILKRIYDNTEDFDKLFEPLNNSESYFNTVFKSFLECFDNNKDYKDCFESTFDKVTTFSNQLSESINNEKMKTIINNINKKYED